MLKAKKSEWFAKFFSLYNRNLFKRRFHSLRVCGLKKLSEKESDIPLVIYANHSSWWDGLTAFQISRAANLDAFVMMEEMQLKKLSLFRKLGAFSVVRESPKQAVESINYAAEVLRENSNRVLWIFPQGEILANDARPLKFFHGLSRIVEKTGKFSTASVAMRYEFLGNYKPEILVKINSSETSMIDKNFNAKSATIYFEKNLAETLNCLKTDILTKNLQSYENII